MAERPIWRGHLRLALVSCPIALYTAHHERENLHFHFINPKTGNRIRMVTEDAETGEELQRRDLVRGYEFEKDRYVLLDTEDFDSARIDSSATLNVEKFVPMDSIDPVYYDSAYFVAPDGDAGQDVYVVLRDAIASSKSVALSRIVISRRERPVAIMPMGRGLVLHTLHEAKDIADPKAIFAGVPEEKPDPEMVKLARMLVERQEKSFAPGDMTDRYEERLREVIEAKLKGHKISEPTVERPDNVVDLMAALKRSLGQSETKKPAAKTPTRAAAKTRREPTKRGPARKRA